MQQNLNFYYITNQFDYADGLKLLPHAATGSCLCAALNNQMKYVMFCFSLFYFVLMFIS